MPLITDETFRRLLANGAAMSWLENLADVDFFPVTKLYTPDGPCTWILTHVFITEPDCAYGLIDSGDGTPRMGSVSMRELEEAAGPLGLALRCDETFASSETISRIAARACEACRIDI
jgi:hypothetical protein